MLVWGGGYRISLLEICPVPVALVWITAVFIVCFFVCFVLSIAGWVLHLCVSYWRVVLFVLAFALVLVLVGFLLFAPEPFCKRLDFTLVDEP